MVKVVFAVWNGQFLRKAIESLNLNAVVKDVQVLNLKNSCEELLKEKADLYVIYQMGRGEWEKELAEKAKIIAFKSSVDDKSVVKGKEYKELYMYLAYDGMENLKNFVLRCFEIASGEKRGAAKPIEMPWNGIYHPEGGYFKSYEEYENWYPFKNFSKKAVVLFYRARFLFNNTAHVDMLIKELESRGIMPIPVFCLTFPDKEAGMPGIEKAIENYVLPAKPDVVIWCLYFRVSRDLELLRKLNVPILNAIELYSTTPEEWMKRDSISPITLSMAVVMPEFDGVINPTVFSGEIRNERILAAVPIEERVKRIAEQAERFINLRKKDNKDKKVAIIMHSSSTGNNEANSGTALGLDSFESVVNILKEMKKAGYNVKVVTKDELIRELEGLWGGRFGCGKRDLEVNYGEWFDNLPEKVKIEMTEKWGSREDFCKIGGVWLGNVFVTVQPPRSGESDHRIVHDPVLPPPHEYLAFYRYVSCFDAIIHVGKHGSVEWLPGKSCCLSNSCYPDVCLSSVPNGYIYIVNNPAEGTQAKRRGYSTIIDHLPPPMECAEIYEDLEEAIESYFKAKERGLKNQVEIIKDKIINLSKKYKFEFESNEDFDDFVVKLHSKLTDINCSLFNEGLHVFGVVRSAEKYALSAVRPELRLGVKSVSERKRIRELFLKALKGEIKEIDGIDVEKFEECVRLGKEVLNRLEKIKELENTLRFLNGEFVEPAPSGDITKGRLETIPTGYNFYSVDPKAIPTKTAWETGKKLTEKLLKKYGKYPETIAFIQWTSDPMNTDGEQIAQILYTLGVEPVWEGKRVQSLRVIPLEELGRPRIDVFVRISGLFRDTFMNLVELIDRAIALVSSLDEPFEMNFVRKHSLEGIKHRIFGDMPGAYGAGVNHAINSSCWESRDELAEIYVEWGKYAYGINAYGVEDRDGMLKAMKNVEVVVRNHYTDEWDIFSDDCPYAFQGGLMLAVEKVRGKRPELYISDTRPKFDGEKVVSVEEEVERVARITLLNDRWIEGMKKHGYKGAGDMMKRIVNMFGWEATTDSVKDWIFDEIAKKYVLNEEMREWFMKNNPYAVEEIARRLVEANRRGFWKGEMVEDVENVYLELEGCLEDY